MLIILILLVLLWAMILFGGFLFGKNDPYQRIPTPNRMLSSLILVFISWMLYALSPSSFSLLIGIGMTLGFIGDLFMAELLVKGEAHILAGMGAFGLGHIAYIVGGYRFATENGLNHQTFWLIGIVSWLLIGLIGWWLAVWRPSTPANRSSIHGGALPYAELLAGTAGVGTALALHTPSFISFSIGAALFLFSDLLIALNLFNGIKLRQHHDLVWLTYGPGQCLIVLTGLFLLTL